MSEEERRALSKKINNKEKCAKIGQAFYLNKKAVKKVGVNITPERTLKLLKDYVAMGAAITGKLLEFFSL